MWISEGELSLEAAGIAAAPPTPRRGRARASSALEWVRERLTTTPGRLVLTSIVVVVGAACFGIIATGAEQSRERAVSAAATATEPLLVNAVNLYAALSDANATVATGLLGVGGLEPQAARNRYLQDLDRATGALTALTRGAGTAGAQASLGAIAAHLPLYSGLVETARANSRQGFPVGAAYLRQAATLLNQTILRAADRVYAIEAGRLNDDYRTGTSSATLVALGAAIALGLVPLLLAQPYVTRISHRVVNVPMLAATVVLAGVSVWALIALTSEQNSLAAAQRGGSDVVEARSAADILLSRAQGDLSLTLVNRGTDISDPLDFTAVLRVLTTGELAPRLNAGFASYWTAAKHVQGLEGGGQLEAAIRQAPAVAAVSERLDRDLREQITVAQDRFSDDAADAASALDGLWLAIPLAAVLAAVLALLGLRQRINEYR
jgi:hypothetical protein